MGGAAVAGTPAGAAGSGGASAAAATGSGGRPGGSSDADHGLTTSAARTAAIASARATLPHRTRRRKSADMPPIVESDRPRPLRAGRAPPRCYHRSPLMAKEPDLYDLIVLLNPAMEEDRLLKIMGDLELLIDQHGTIVSRHEWGVRKTAFEIRKSPKRITT
jgi:hypothetical protein